jgi:hypothetical protein
VDEHLSEIFDEEVNLKMIDETGDDMMQTG